MSEVASPVFHLRCEITLVFLDCTKKTHCWLDLLGPAELVWGLNNKTIDYSAVQMTRLIDSTVYMCLLDGLFFSMF